MYTHFVYIDISARTYIYVLDSEMDNQLFTWCSQFWQKNGEKSSIVKETIFRSSNYFHSLQITLWSCPKVRETLFLYPIFFLVFWGFLIKQFELFRIFTFEEKKMISSRWFWRFFYGGRSIMASLTSSGYHYHHHSHSPPLVPPPQKANHSCFAFSLFKNVLNFSFPRRSICVCMCVSVSFLVPRFLATLSVSLYYLV